VALATLYLKLILLREYNTFSKQHGIEMFQQNDKAHLAAMNKMRALMQTVD
jgi:hypothetical protein